MDENDDSLFRCIVNNKEDSNNLLYELFALGKKSCVWALTPLSCGGEPGNFVGGCSA